MYIVELSMVWPIGLIQSFLPPFPTGTVSELLKSLLLTQGLTSSDLPSWIDDLCSMSTNVFIRRLCLSSSLIKKGIPRNHQWLIDTPENLLLSIRPMISG